MATITKYLASRSAVSGMREICLRVNYSRDLRFRVHTGLTINPDRFADGKIKMPRIANSEAVELKKTEQRLTDIESAIFEYLAENEPTKDGIDAIVKKANKTKKQIKPREKRPKVTEFFDAWQRFIAHKDFSEHWQSQYRNLMRLLQRYELYRKKHLKLTDFDVNEFITFYRNEPRIFDERPDIYEKIPVDSRRLHKNHRPRPRGDNAVCDIIKKLSAFLNWCVNVGLITRSPMSAYKGVREEVYGKPIYLSKEERDALYGHDMDHRPHLAMQRDVFVFQCLTGCRIGDLYSLTRDNIVGDTLQYVPGKTRKERADVVVVPLLPMAREILERYKELPTLLPLISQQRYNEAIKEACKTAGLDRVVTVINPTTGQDERKPIWQVASSHMARRTFVGNLYKSVKDQELVASLSGHKEGSRAFARYRDIDEDIKRDVISLLE